MKEKARFDVEVSRSNPAIGVGKYQNETLDDQRQEENEVGPAILRFWDELIQFCRCAAAMTSPGEKWRMFLI